MQVSDPRTEDPREFWGESGQLDPLDQRFGMTRRATSGPNPSANSVGGRGRRSFATAWRFVLHAHRTTGRARPTRSRLRIVGVATVSGERRGHGADGRLGGSQHARSRRGSSPCSSACRPCRDRTTRSSRSTTRPTTPITPRRQAAAKAAADLPRRAAPADHGRAAAVAERRGPVRGRHVQRDRRAAVERQRFELPRPARHASRCSRSTTRRS